MLIDLLDSAIMSHSINDDDDDNNNASDALTTPQDAVTSSDNPSI
jgi:hypothetical protein